MKEFQDKVAVMTGGASGIGRALAEKCIEEGMKVVLADIEEAALTRTVKELRAKGADNLLAVQTDVSKAASIEALAEQAYAAYGAVHLLFNNAGVGTGGLIWQNTVADWEWVLGVNLWGVIHGIHNFVPRMLKQSGEAYIVNTASMAGMNAAPGLGAYCVSKFGVVALTETLYKKLAMTGANIKVSVLCPGFIKTAITDASRNRQAEFKNAETDPDTDLNTTNSVAFLRQALQSGMEPREVAQIVFEAIRNEQFYIFTHPEMNQSIQNRMEAILEGAQSADASTLNQPAVMVSFGARSEELCTCSARHNLTGQVNLLYDS